MSRITLAREYPDDRDVIAQICKLKSRTSATEKETSQIEQHLNNTDQRVTTLETVTQGLTPEDIETVKTVADDVQQLESEVTALDGRVDTLEIERTSDRQYIEAVADDLVQNYATKNALQGVSTSASQTQTQLTNLATEIQTTHPYVTTNTEQTITAVKNITVIGETSEAIINKGFVQATDGRNNIAHTNQGNVFSLKQTIDKGNGRCEIDVQSASYMRLTKYQGDTNNYVYLAIGLTTEGEARIWLGKNTGSGETETRIHYL